MFLVSRYTVYQYGTEPDISAWPDSPLGLNRHKLTQNKQHRPFAQRCFYHI